MNTRFRRSAGILVVGILLSSVAWAEWKRIAGPTSLEAVRDPRMRSGYNGGGLGIQLAQGKQYRLEIRWKDDEQAVKVGAEDPGEGITGWLLIDYTAGDVERDDDGRRTGWYKVTETFPAEVSRRVVLRFILKKQGDFQASVFEED